MRGVRMFYNYGIYMSNIAALINIIISAALFTTVVLQ
jgi:hypothetical protein